MTLRFHKTTIYFKQYFATLSLNEISFADLCKKIEEFPLKEDYSAIKGLNLSGDHYFKKILLSEAKELGIDEIEQIKCITPIVDQAPMPFVMERDYFEVSLPTEGKNYKKLIESVLKIEEYYKDLLEDVIDQKIEIHLRGGAGMSLNRQIYQNAIPNFPTGSYDYQTIENKEFESGQIPLPGEYSKLPDNIRKFIKVIQGPYTLKLLQNKNKLILKQVKKQEIGISLYSDHSDWFCKALDVCKEARLFKEPVLVPNRYHALPHLTGGHKED